MASAKTKSLKGTESGVVGHRILAVIIDWIILTIISFAIVGSSFIGSGFNFGALFGSIMIVVLINFLYGFILEGWRGQTIGKMALGIIVTKEDDKPCDYPAAFIRNILRIIDVLPSLYILGLIVILVTKRKQRIGDLAAHTVVVRINK